MIVISSSRAPHRPHPTPTKIIQSLSYPSLATLATITDFHCRGRGALEPPDQRPPP